jgi:hypothetical protein
MRSMSRRNASGAETQSANLRLRAGIQRRRRGLLERRSLYYDPLNGLSEATRNLELERDLSLETLGEGPNIRRLLLAEERSTHGDTGRVRSR